MIKTVDQTTVADIFSINSDKVYRIPKYQREYTWGINDWDALFNDVTENDYGYFLGSYICVNSGSLNGTVLEVIDGQQRFSTLSLLLTALYEKLSLLESQMELEDKTDLSNLKSELAKNTDVARDLTPQEQEAFEDRIIEEDQEERRERDESILKAEEERYEAEIDEAGRLYQMRKAREEY